MAQRIITGLILVAVLFLVVLLCPAWVAMLLTTLLCVWAYLELISCLKVVRSPWLHACGVLMSAVVPVLSWLGFSFLAERVTMLAFVLALLVCWMAEHDRGRMDFRSMTAVFFAALLLPLFYSALIRILRMENGRMLVLLPFITAYVCDTAAFFTGRLFGKHRLAPKISPKKSIEGAVAGVLATVVGCLLYGLILQYGWKMTVHYGALALYGLIGSVAGILGDLALSLIKREVGIKDFGNVFPGHGGLLDRFDSLLLTAPVIEILLLLLPGVMK